MASDIGLKIDNRYEVLSELGRGGMGVVYKAVEMALGRPVAIKMLNANVAANPKDVERFLAEGRTAAMMPPHPNVVIIYSTGKHEGMPYIAMEYVQGVTLRDILSSGASLSLMSKLDYVIQVCRALDYAHQFGIVHRDVKPANVMVVDKTTERAGAKSKEKSVKLLDFGIAKVADKSLTATGMGIGTLSYMSPQQILPKKDHVLDGRSDVFSTGVMLFELLTGHLPWTGESEYEILNKIINDPVPPLSTYLQNYPASLDRVLQRALTKDVDSRYATADEMAQELSDVQTALKDEVLASAHAALDAGDGIRAFELVTDILSVDTKHRAAVDFRNHLPNIAELEKQSEEVRHLRAEAEQALNQKRYQDALNDIEQAIRLNSTNTELLNCRDVIRQQLRRRDEVQKKLELAKHALEINDLIFAQELVDKVIGMDPTDTQARMMKSVIEHRVEQDQKQKRMQDLAEEAERALQLRNIAGAQEAVRKIEALDANFPGLGSLKQSVVEAAAQEQRRREVDSAMRDLQQMLAHGEVQKTLTAADQALKRFPGDTGLLRVRQQAEARFEAVQREKSIQEQLAAIHAFRDRGDLAQGLRVAEEAFKKFPDSRLQGLAEQLREQNERQQREQVAQASLKRAQDAMKDGRYDTAVRILIQAGQESPSPAIADALRLARQQSERAAQGKAADQRRAVAELESALASEPDPAARLRLAEQSVAAHPGNVSLEQLASQVRQWHDQIAALVERATGFEVEQDYLSAIAEWERLRDSYPQYPNLDAQIRRLNTLLAPAAEPPQAPAAPPLPSEAPPAPMSATSFLDAAAIRARAAAPSEAPPFAPPSAPPSAPAFGATSMVSSQAAAARMASAPAPARTQAPPVMPEVAKPAPAPARKVPAAVPPPPSSRPWIYVGGAVALLVIAIAAYFVLAPSKTVAVHFEAQPAGADIAVAGKHCAAPCDLKLAPGDYTIKASHDGYEAAEQTITVGTAPLNAPAITLSPAVAPRAATGMLAVETNVDGVDVFVDGALKGSTSGNKATLTLMPGAHDIRGEKAGYDAATQHVEIAKDAQASVQLTLNKSAAGTATTEVRDPYLMVKGTPGALVKIDRRTVGAIGPDGNYSYQPKPGRHTVEITLDGYQPLATAVNLKAGETHPLAAELKAIPKPPVAQLAASTNSITQGQAVELRWQTSNAASVSIDHGVGTVSASGSQQVHPTETTTYTLTASGEGRPATAKVTINVGAAAKAPIIAIFEAGSDTVQAGKSVKLIWDTQNASDVSIAPEVGSVDARGTREVRPSATTTYTLTAKGPGGTQTKTYEVKVETARTEAATPAAKPAETKPAEDPEVAAVKGAIQQRFKDAYESMSTSEMEKVWPNMPKDVKKALDQSFKAARAIRVNYACNNPVISGATAQVLCSETLTYTTSSGSVQKPQTNPMSFQLSKAGGGWVVEGRRYAGK